MNFAIEGLDRNTDNGVLTVYWRAYKTQGDHVSEFMDALYMNPDPSSEDYIEYEDLTEEIVIGWVRETLNETQLNARLTDELAEKVSPTILTGTPWE